MSRVVGEPLITPQQVMLLRSYVKLLFSPKVLGRVKTRFDHAGQIVGRFEVRFDRSSAL